MRRFFLFKIADNTAWPFKRLIPPLAVTALLLLYILAFPYLVERFGSAGRVFTATYVLPATLMWGLRSGLFMCVLTVILDFLLMRQYGVPNDTDLIGLCIMFVVVLAIGCLKDLSRALKEKIEAYAVAEKALQASEEKYRQVFETESDGVGLLEADTGVFFDINRAAVEMLGYRREELLAMRIDKLSKDFKHAPLIGEREVRRKYISCLKRKNNTDFPAEVTLRGFRLNGRSVAVLVIKDISERIKTENEKEKFGKLLQQAYKMEAVGTLAGGISHDFNNILGAILGYADLLQLHGVTLSDKQQSYLENIREAARRARDLVRQILTFSRQTKVEKRPVMVKPIIEEVLKLIRASIPSTVEIKHSFSTEKDTIIANSTQLHQIIMNLCTNAFQSMPDGHGRIEITVTDEYLDNTFIAGHPGLELGEYLKITVRDTGCGIKSDILGRIFDPYFSTKGEEGTGLGLSVVHGIVKDHHGCITVESAPDLGTIFSIYFPLAISTQESVDMPDTEAGTGNERILVVDDDPVIAKMMAEILETIGYHVEVRVSSLEALEFFKAKSRFIDLVISDLTMPNMTGIELGQALIKVNADIPVIICTGFSDNLDEFKARSFGFKKLLRKPVSAKDLSVAVQEALNGH